MAGGGVLARFYGPGGGALFARGVGNLPIKKLPGHFARGMVKFGID